MNTPHMAASDERSLNAVLPTLAPHAAVLDSMKYDELKGLLGRYEDDLASVREQGRALRIAVIGQMKVGKSSFLNAALLGEDVLPRAATPMTAALTRIQYSERPRAKVVFYTPDDWRGIEACAAQCESRLAEEERKWAQGHKGSSAKSPFATTAQSHPPRATLLQGIEPSLRASHELVQKAHAQCLDLATCLGQTPEVLAGSNAELNRRLLDYVGADGQFTPIVKMIELYINNPRLEGLEIVDTPGFNDPVLSRGKATREFLARCDVVFLFSTVSQFLAAADLNLLREQLPEAGVSDTAVFVVGSRRDDALRQELGFTKDAARLVQQKGIALAQADAALLAFTLQLLDRKTAETGRQAIERQHQEASTRGDERAKVLLGRLRETTPRFVAAQLALWAQDVDALQENDRYHLDQLSAALGRPLDAEDLLAIANLEPLKEELLAQRSRQQELVEQKEANLHNDVRAAVGTRLEVLAQALTERAERIRTGDVAHLDKQRVEVEHRLRAGRGKVEDVFDTQITQVQHDFARLKMDFQTLAASSVHVETRTETHTRSYEVSTSSWYNPLSWGSSVTRHETVVTRYADVQDAVENVDKFVNHATRALSEQIMRCVDLDAIRRKVSQAALSLFDIGSADFDAELIMSEVNKSLRRLTVPDATLNRTDYSSRITSAFGQHRIKEDQIGALRESARQVIEDILLDLGQALENKLVGIVNGLNLAGQQLVAQLISDIQAGLDELRQQIEHREASLAAIAQASSAVERARIEMQAPSRTTYAQTDCAGA